MKSALLVSLGLWTSDKMEEIKENIAAPQTAVLSKQKGGKKPLHNTKQEQTSCEMFYSFIKATSSTGLETSKMEGDIQSMKQNLNKLLVESAHQVMMHSVLRMEFFLSFS